MFPLSKLRELSPRTRMRKIARILQGLEVELAAGRPVDEGYASALCALADAPAPAPESPPADLLRHLNSVRHGILRAQGAEPSEWDLLSLETGLLDRSAAVVRPMRAYLEDIRSPFNVGSMFRTAEAFGAGGLVLSPRTPLPSHPRAAKTAKGAERALAWEVGELASLESAEGVFALELGGVPIGRFAFPARGVVLVGSEELGLSPEALALADRGLGRVSIPLAGAKRSLNVSVAFGILMQAWRAALEARERR